VKIGTFVEIQKGAKIGNRCKISSHTFICEGVVLEDEVFVGHHVVFTNDRYPRATNENGGLQTESDWHCVPTLVRRGASIGSGAVFDLRNHSWQERDDWRGQHRHKKCSAGHDCRGNPARIVKSLLKNNQPAGSFVLTENLITAPGIFPVAEAPSRATGVQWINPRSIRTGRARADSKSSGEIFFSQRGLGKCFYGNLR